MSIIRPGSNRITSRASVSPWRIHLRQVQGLRPGGRVWEGSDRRIYLGGQRQTLHQLEGLWIG